MKVYIVTSGVVIEGGGVDGVFDTLEKATEFLTNRERFTEYTRLPHDETGKCKRWYERDGFYYICIQEWDVG
jgi:hypothetical protein